MSPIRTTLRRAGLVAGLTSAAVLAAAGAAFAHVTVHPESYAKGATDGVLTFRVPNEEDTASTTKVQVFLPTDHPVLGVLVTPQAGWTAKVTHTTLKTPVTTDDGTITDAVSEITWTGGTIGSGQYEDFDVAFGQLPDDTDQLSFKTLQTYSDGTVVRWIEEPQKGGALPEQVDALYAAVREMERLRCEGLMCIPPPDQDPRPHFRALRQMRDRLGLRELSMGMTADFEVAIEEGATIVRIGTAIFGERPRR